VSHRHILVNVLRAHSEFSFEFWALSFVFRLLTPNLMHRKNRKHAALLSPFEGRELEAGYLAYIDCFNRQLFFEAHDVLEEIWLPQRNSAMGRFYKGLIQLAGAFVHLQKERPQPAAALLRLARANLRAYGPVCRRLMVEDALTLIETWLRELESVSCKNNPLSAEQFPKLKLADPPSPFA
jgi:predicted metal-dependent hydrolase